MATPGFGEARKQREEKRSRGGGGGGKTFNPGAKGVDRLLYIGSDWGLELYDLLVEIAAMDDLVNEEGESTKELDFRTRVLRSNAKLILERIRLATGKEGPEKAMEDGKIVQIPVTKKEQQFLIEVGDYFDLDEEAMAELRTLPAKGWY